MAADVATSYVDLAGFKFFRCEVGSRVHEHGAGLYMKLGLGAVDINVGFPNVLVVNVLSWDAYAVVVYRPPSFGTVHKSCTRPIFQLQFVAGVVRWDWPHILCQFLKKIEYASVILVKSKIPGTETLIY